MYTLEDFLPPLMATIMAMDERREADPVKAFESIDQCGSDGNDPSFGWLLSVLKAILCTRV